MHDQHHHGNRFQDVARLRSPERMQWLEVDRVVALALENLPARSVIDIGTGSGIFAEAFARRGLRVSGIDANPQMLQTAWAFVPEADFRTAEAESNPFEDDSFDLAFMGLVLHETDDLLQALREAYRVSKARLVILEWPYEQQDFGPGMDERIPPEQLMDLAREVGFTGGEIIRLEQLVLYRFDKPRQTPGG